MDIFSEIRVLYIWILSSCDVVYKIKIFKNFYMDGGEDDKILILVSWVFIVKWGMMGKGG